MVYRQISGKCNSSFNSLTTAKQLLQWLGVTSNMFIYLYLLCLMLIFSAIGFLRCPRFWTTAPSNNMNLRMVRFYQQQFFLLLSHENGCLDKPRRPKTRSLQIRRITQGRRGRLRCSGWLREEQFGRIFVAQVSDDFHGWGAGRAVWDEQLGRLLLATVPGQ